MFLIPVQTRGCFTTGTTNASSRTNGPHVKKCLMCLYIVSLESLVSSLESSVFQDGPKYIHIWLFSRDSLGKQQRKSLGFSH